MRQQLDSAYATKESLQQSNQQLVKIIHYRHCDHSHTQHTCTVSVMTHT